LFISPTAAVEVPAGAVITNSEREEVFAEALTGLLECFQQQTLCGQSTP